MNDIIKKFTQHEIFQKIQVFIVPAVAVVMTVILSFLVIFPQIKNFLADNNSISETNQKYSLLINNKIDFLQQVSTSSYKADINTSFVALPIDQNIPEALSQITFLLSSSKLKIAGISISGISSSSNDSNKNTEVSSFQTKVDISGDIKSLQGFIQKLNQLPRVMKIAGINVSQDRTTQNIQATLTIQIFYQELPINLGNIYQTVSQPTQQELDLLKKIEVSAQAVPTNIGTRTGSVGLAKTDPFQ